MGNRINGFEQIKSFYSWVFNNPDKVRPTHISLYLFLWNQGNRANWVEWFKCPYDLAMQGACIGNKGTYYKCLDELQKFKLIKYKKGINNYKAPQINLIKLYESEPLTGQVTVPLSEPQTVPLSGLLPVPIYKLITSNLELVTNNIGRWIKDELKNREGIIPEYLDFKDYAVEKSLEVGIDLDLIKLKLKFDAWKEDGWKTGGKNPKKIKNWKSTLNNSLIYLKKEEKSSAKKENSYEAIIEANKGRSWNQ